MIKRSERMVGDVRVVSVSPVTTNAGTRDIFFIHMSWGGAWAFDLYMDYFAHHGHNTHALDLRGHGKSGGTVEGTSMQDYVNDVKDAIDTLPLENPIVVGHSMGGLVALMYSAQHGSSGTVSIDGSPPLEVQKTSEEKHYPLSYTPQDSGMPRNPIKTMMLLPDIYPWRLMKLKMNLKVESGVARTDRKIGVSIPKEKLNMPLLFIGAANGTSLPGFGIGIKKARAQAEYYGAPIVEIEDATHPGILIGKHWKKSADAILEWLP